MTRLFLISERNLPDSLMDFLETSDELQIVSEMDSSDVLLFYTSLWNRDALHRTSDFHHKSKPLFVLYEQAEERFVTNSILQNQVQGILRVSTSPEQILSGLRACASGLQVLQNDRWNDTDRGTILLTPREMEILRLIADGEGNKTIADILNISQHTVKFHISSIFEKLHVSSRTEAVKAGVTRGYISI
jgi:DNA-binding NarL/FixJ family response regulator